MAGAPPLFVSAFVKNYPSLLAHLAAVVKTMTRQRSDDNRNLEVVYVFAVSPIRLQNKHQLTFTFSPRH